jgi:hypothetical protein
MAQAVSSQAFTAETRLQSLVRPFEICGGRSGTGKGLSPITSGFPTQYYASFPNSFYNVSPTSYILSNRKCR